MLPNEWTDSEEQVQARLRTAQLELEAQVEFPFVVVNDRLEQATDELVEIVRADLAASAAGGDAR